MSPPTDPYADFVPRWGTRVARVAAVLVLAAFTFWAVSVPGQEGQKGDWTIADRLLMFGSGCCCAYLLYRFGAIRATPSPEGLYVRNILRARTLSWAEIVRVQMGEGAPWATLDLVDADTVAVMAIQKVDGEHARAMASRLAALVQVHGEIDEPPE